MFTSVSVNNANVPMGLGNVAVKLAFSSSVESNTRSCSASSDFLVADKVLDT